MDAGDRTTPVPDGEGGSAGVRESAAAIEFAPPSGELAEEPAAVSSAQAPALEPLEPLEPEVMDAPEPIEDLAGEEPAELVAAEGAATDPFTRLVRALVAHLTECAPAGDLPTFADGVAGLRIADDVDGGLTSVH